VSASRVIVVLAVSLAAVAIVACGADNSDPPQALGEHPCRASVRYDAGTGQTGGQLIAYFAVTAASADTCSMAGYPSIQLIDANGRAMTTRSVRRTDIAVRRVVVHRSSPGVFSISYRYLTTDGHGCRTAPRAIRVRLPGEGWDLTVPVDGRAPDLRSFSPCGGTIQVSPIIG